MITNVASLFSTAQRVEGRPDAGPPPTLKRLVSLKRKPPHPRPGPSSAAELSRVEHLAQREGNDISYIIFVDLRGDGRVLERDHLDGASLSLGDGGRPPAREPLDAGDSEPGQILPACSPRRRRRAERGEVPVRRKEERRRARRARPRPRSAASEVGRVILSARLAVASTTALNRRQVRGGRPRDTNSVGGP